MSTLTVDISIPKSWAELSQRQLEYLFISFACAAVTQPDEMQWPTAAAYCLTKWAGIKVLGPYGKIYLVKIGKTEGFVSKDEVASAIDALTWSKEPPEYPVRLERLGRAKARYDAELHGMTFEQYLSTETLWMAYAATPDDRILAAMANNLYLPPRFSSKVKPNNYQLLAVWYWWASVKKYLASLYPDFLTASEAPTGKAPSRNEIRRSLDAQIRALTKGDVSKESEILALDVHRALTELDALAREYKELEAKYGKL